MTLARFACVPVAAALLAIPALTIAGQPTHPAAETTARLSPAELVRDLADPAYSVRERASRELWALGTKAGPALRAAAAGSDPEVAQRAREILDKFDAGIFPDTPPAVMTHIAEFRTGLVEKQLPAITGLVKLGEKGLPTLRALLSRDLPPDNRGPVFDHLCWTLRTEVPKVLFAGRPDLAEEMLSLNALGNSDQGMTDYAVLLKQRGRAVSAADELEAARKAGRPTAEAATRALVFVHRAAGNSPRAKALAGGLADADSAARPVYDALLEDAAGWGELADRSANGLGSANSRDGLTLFRLRLAGRVQQADTLADQQKDADVGDRGRFGSVDEPTMALMLGGRPLDGIDRMRVKRNLPHILADVLAARLEFKDALALVTVSPAAKQALETDGYDVPMLTHLYGTRKGRLLAQVGEREASAQVFNGLADQLGVQGRDEYALSQLLRAEVRAGRYDLACEHLARALGSTEKDRDEGWLHGGRLDPFEAVFEGDAEAAQYWWRTLRGVTPAPADPAGQTMRKVRALLTGAATADDLDRAAKAAAADTPSPDSPRGQAQALALAAAYRPAGRTTDAIAALAEVADKLADADDPDAPQARRNGRGSRSWVFGTDERFRLWMELGDLLADAGRFADAAKRYEQGWHRHPDNAVLLFLSGRALLKTGNAAEGQRRVELAHWVGLGNARVRGRFLEELVGRGFAADVRAERDLIREAGWLSELYLGNVWNQMARASAYLKDYDAAAAANRRAIHYLLRTPGVSYVEGYAYLTVPQAVLVYEARARLAAGKVDDAVSLATECLAVLPGNTDVPAGLVPGLDRLGRTADADKLFRHVWDAYGKLIAAHPGSGWARYSAAWLAAGCRRELDAALAHATKAVALDPDARSFKEALAEVRFRRGERTDAVAVMTKLSAADPRNHHYRRQLERYKTAGFDSPLPEAGDD